MAKYSFMIRLLILLIASTICICLIIGIFSRSNYLVLQAKLDNQKIVLNISEEIKKSSIDESAKTIEESSEINYIPQNLYADLHDKNVITIVVKDLGLSKLLTDKAMDLPNQITLGFSPYTVNLEEYMHKAIAKNFDVLINIPMETKNYPQDDPGPLGLLRNLSDLENFQRFETAIGNNNYFKGIYTAPDEVFTYSIDKISSFLKKLQELDLIYVYNGSTQNEAFRQFATQNKFKINEIDLSIDAALTEDAIYNQLSLLEKIAETKGFAIGSCGLYPITIEVLNKWISQLSQKNILLVPISVLNKKLAYIAQQK